MNRFRRKKDNSHSNSSHDNPSLAAAATTTNDPIQESSDATPSHNSLNESLQAMDALVDSDPESTEIFDDGDVAEDAFPPPSPSTSASSAMDAVRHLASPLFGGGARSGGRSFHGRDLDEEGDSSSSSSSSSNDDDDQSPNTQDDSHSQEGEDDEEKKSDHSSGEDYSDDEDEGEEGYRPGGYHRVSVGEVYNQRYVCEYMNR